MQLWCGLAKDGKSGKIPSWLCRKAVEDGMRTLCFLWTRNTHLDEESAGFFFQFWCFWIQEFSWDLDLDISDYYKAKNTPCLWCRRKHDGPFESLEKSLLLLIVRNDGHLVKGSSGFGVSGLWAQGLDTLLLELRYYFKMLNIDGALYLAVEKVSPVIWRGRVSFSSWLADFLGYMV